MFLEFKSILFGRQVLHKSLMSSCDFRLLHCRHSIGHNGLRLGDVFLLGFWNTNFQFTTNVY